MIDYNKFLWLFWTEIILILIIFIIVLIEAIKQHKILMVDKMKKTKCIICKRIKTSEQEGRIMDGSWQMDKLLSDKYKFQWICCYECYLIAIEKSKKDKE